MKTEQRGSLAGKNDNVVVRSFQPLACLQQLHHYTILLEALID
jgi:hypothetical protein